MVKQTVLCAVKDPELSVLTDRQVKDSQIRLTITYLVTRLNSIASTIGENVSNSSGKKYIQDQAYRMI